MNIYNIINNQYAFRAPKTYQYHKMQLKPLIYRTHWLSSETIVKLPVTRQEESSDQKNGDG